MGSQSIKLPLSADERALLRKNRIRISQIAEMSFEQFHALTGMPDARARELVSLAAFQTIPDIGPVMAECLVLLGYRHPRELSGRDPAQMLDALEERLGYWVDPCVEDQLRLAVHFSDHPGVSQRWWDFTDERKAYRKQHGYPSTRPTLAWDDPSRQST